MNDKKTIYVCSACGKTSETKEPTDDHGWDVSCMIHAVLCYEHTLQIKDGRVVYADKVIKELK